MRLLITGASGFSGTFLIQEATTLQDLEVFGLINRRTPETVQGVSFIQGDLLIKGKLEDILHRTRPDAIIHLAGLNKGSFDRLFQTNVLGTYNLLDAVRKESPETNILVISSSAIYGYSGDSPISEVQGYAPLSEYGVSKASQEILTLQYTRKFGMKIAIARPFNLFGPAQSKDFLCSSIASQIINIERGNRNSIQLNETVSKRDFIDVRDVVRGYLSIILHPEFGSKCSGNTFNLGSGCARSVLDILSVFEKITGEKYPLNLPENVPEILIPTQTSNNGRIRQLTGWMPEIPLEQTLRDMLVTERSINSR